MPKFTTVKFSEKTLQPTMRLDARFWIQKHLLNQRRKNGSRKTSLDRSAKIFKQSTKSKS